MIFDTDDLHETNHRLDLLHLLKEANPLFRMTAFVVPTLCSQQFLDDLPEWIECAAHGWHHGGPACTDAREAEEWTYEQAIDVMLSVPERMAGGWKSPGWRVSDGTYQALLDLGWWCADHPDNNDRRPDGLRVHVHGQGDHVHTHVQNVCGNGLEESWLYLLERVRAAASFELVSESVSAWKARVLA